MIVALVQRSLGADSPMGCSKREAVVQANRANGRSRRGGWLSRAW